MPSLIASDRLPHQLMPSLIASDRLPHQLMPSLIASDCLPHQLMPSLIAPFLRRATTLLVNLGFSDELRARPMAALSGGWRVRTCLAAAIFGKL